MQRLFTSISEPIADFKWQKLFNERWPAYKAWLHTGHPAIDSKIALSALEKYMPEMMGTHEHLCRLVHAEESAISFLTGFQPPAYNSACSQAVSINGPVQLVRNYDYHADRFEGILIKTAWNGKKVIANSDCLIGVLDGMNEDGLTLSLTFGGRMIVGFGFGIPFILRYILEFCSNVKEAVDVLVRVPSHMSYNVTITDKSGIVKTVQIAPDRPAVVTKAAFSTNHQGPVEWAENAGFNETAQRATFLENTLFRRVNGDALTEAFLKPPLYNKQYHKGLGTLYTAVYYPEEGKMEMRWPQNHMTQSFSAFKEEKKIIKLNSNSIPFTTIQEN